MPRLVSSFVVASAFAVVAFCAHVGDHYQVEATSGKRGTLDLLVVREGFTCGDAFDAAYSSMVHSANPLYFANKYTKRPASAPLSPIGRQEAVALSGSETLAGYKDIDIVFCAETPAAVETAALLFPGATLVPVPMLTNVTVSDADKQNIAMFVDENLRDLNQKRNTNIELRMSNLWNGRAVKEVGKNNWDRFLDFLGRIYLPAQTEHWLEDQEVLDERFKKTYAVVTDATIMQHKGFNGCKKSAYHKKDNMMALKSWTPKAQSVITLQYHVVRDDSRALSKTRFQKAASAVRSGFNKVVSMFGGGGGNTPVEGRPAYDKTPSYKVELVVQQEEKRGPYDKNDLRPTCWVLNDGFEILKNESFCEADFSCPRGMPKPETLETKHENVRSKDLAASQGVIKGNRKTLNDLAAGKANAQDFSELSTFKKGLNYGAYAAGWLTGGRLDGMHRTKDYFDREEERQAERVAKAQEGFEKARGDLDSLAKGKCYVEGNVPFGGSAPEIPTRPLSEEEEEGERRGPVPSAESQEEQLLRSEAGAKPPMDFKKALLTGLDEPLPPSPQSDGPLDDKPKRPVLESLDEDPALKMDSTLADPGPDFTPPVPAQEADSPFKADSPTDFKNAFMDQALLSDKHQALMKERSETDDLLSEKHQALLKAAKSETEESFPPVLSDV